MSLHGASFWHDSFWCSKLIMVFHWRIMRGFNGRVEMLCSVMHCRHTNQCVCQHGCPCFLYVEPTGRGEMDRGIPCAHLIFICQSLALTSIMRHHTLLHLLLSCTTIIHAIVWCIVPYVMIKGAGLDKVELSFPCFLEKPNKRKTWSAGGCCHDFWELSAVPS